jgi:TPR repeat protein
VRRELGGIYLRGDGVVNPDLSRAAEAFDKACNKNDAAGCEGLADLYVKGQGGVPLDLIRASALYQQACDGGAPRACTSLGILYTQNPFRDFTRAAFLFQQACNGGDAAGCSNWGDALVTGRGTKKDRATGVRYLQLGCRQGNSWGCDRLRALGEDL